MDEVAKSITVQPWPDTPMTAVFSTPGLFRQPVLQYEEGKEFLLVIDYVFTWESNGIFKRFWIPAGYNYDKASVPRHIGPLLGFDRDGVIEAAALLHDRLYQFKGKLPVGEYQTLVNGRWVNDPSPWTREQADELLRWMAVLGGMPEYKAWIVKQAVRNWPPNWFKGF